MLRQNPIPASPHFTSIGIDDDSNQLSAIAQGVLESIARMTKQDFVPTSDNFQNVQERINGLTDEEKRAVQDVFDQWKSHLTAHM